MLESVRSMQCIHYMRSRGVSTIRGSHPQYKWRFSLAEGIVYYRADVHNSGVSIKMGSTVLSGSTK